MRDAPCKPFKLSSLFVSQTQQGTLYFITFCFYKLTDLPIPYFIFGLFGNSLLQLTRFFVCFLRDTFAVQLNNADGSRLNLQNSLYGDKSLRIKKSSANQDISGFCEVQSITVKIIQFVLSKYFNIVFLQPAYENKQVFIALTYSFFEARSFFDNFANYSDDIFYRKDARLWMRGLCTTRITEC